MKVSELLDEYQVTLYLFPETMWERRGFYFPDERIIYVNGNQNLKLQYTVVKTNNKYEIGSGSGSEELAKLLGEGNE